MADKETGSAQTPEQRLDKALTERNAAAFEQAAREVDPKELEARMDRIKQAVAEKVEMKQAVERLRESLAIDKSLEGLDARLKKVEMLTRMLAPTAAPTAQPAPASKPGETTPAQATTPATSAEATTFGMKVSAASIAASLRFGPLIATIRKIPFAESLLGIDKTDDASTAVKKAILTVLSSPGLIGIDTSGPILGRVFGKTQEMAKQQLASLQNAPKQEAQTKEQEQKAAAETARNAELKKAMPDVDLFETAATGGVTLKNEKGKIKLLIPADLDVSEHAAITAIAKNLRNSSINEFRPAKGDMTRAKPGIRFSAEGDRRVLEWVVPGQQALKNFPLAPFPTQLDAARPGDTFRFEPSGGWVLENQTSSLA